MDNKEFTHLHLHTQYSLLDGAISFDRLFKKCAKTGMNAVAMTDHGNMFGAIEFYNDARKANIKPIIGIEAYIAPGSRLDKNKSSISEAAYHIVLLAKDITGYKNLLKLSSIGYTEGFYYRPRIDKEVLKQFSEGLICLSACVKGEVGQAAANGDLVGAMASAQSYLDIFGPERFFIELQHHPDSDLPDTRRQLSDVADKLGLGLVATNDSHFVDEDDWEAHGVLCAISTGKTVNDTDRMLYPKGVFVKSPQQMREMFTAWPSACDNTKLIADMCNVELDLKARHAPVYRPEDKTSPEDYLTARVYEGAITRYGKVTPEIKARIERELDVIKSKGFASYFLIVWDFCNYASQNSIPVGARGSGVGTIVGYCLGLCNVDPIRYDLLFERFMDPERNEMPDIDIDMCQDGRAKVIEYVRKKYGHVAQIITFGTMKAKAVIRDVARVLAVPLSEADRLAKLIPNTLNITLEDALQAEPELKKLYDESELYRKVIDIGQRLEGLARHASVHAAGVVVADQDLTDFVPLYKAADSDDLVTQFEGPTVEKVGLLKMDFLGLRTLSVLERAKHWVKDLHGITIDLETIEMNDPRVFEVFCKGNTKGIFQFESGGMQDLLMKMRPDRVEDLIAANALYRPGPMQLVPDYIERKHGGKWEVPHPIMKEILEETFGIMVYQEQVMRICNRLGEIPLRQAYTLIKAISKKKIDTIAKERERFIEGCKEKGLTENQAQDIFELIERFAGYGFNKSHSTRYAFIAYQTAYMKAYWPLEYMAALLTYESGFMDKVVEYIEEAQKMGIKIFPPDINESFSDFTVVYETSGQKESGYIRFGLGAVKGVGDKAVEQIIAAREKVGRFKNIFHFCETVDLRCANKNVCEALIKAGAFDKFGGHRAQLLAALERAMVSGQSLQSDKLKGQFNLFGGPAAAAEEAKEGHSLPDISPWPELMMLAFEKDVLGFYVTSNPLSKHAMDINAYSNVHVAELGQSRDGQEVIIGGMITKIRNSVTKTGRSAGSKMAVFILQDLTGTCEVVLFPESLAKNEMALELDRIVFVRGKVDCRRELPNIIANELITIEEAGDKLASRGISLTLHSASINEEKISQLRALCGVHKGKSPVFVTVITEKGTRIQTALDRNYAIRVDGEFKQRVETLFGPGVLELCR
ncbi:MAG: DNA polymerase III subunit alpha [Planctomycetes bacterium GWF2_50_10]|nr:MAG: DNA polymerase III subunit alpha [Planctomycetes bacterium GWF2_50_10]